MSHNRLYVGVNIIVPAEEVVLVIGIAVEGVIGAKEFNEINLARTLREVRLYGNAVCHLDLTELLHQLIGTARNKSRGKYRLGILKLVLGGVYPAKGGKGRNLCALLGESLACFPIHINLANVADKSALLHKLH